MTSDRYQATGPQAEFQPGSANRVLLNKQGITDPAVMDEVELQLLLQLYEHVLRAQLPDRRLEVADLMEWHRQWLGNLYDWAGQQRSVNIAKEDFHFAAAAQIPRLLADVMAVQAGRGPLDYSRWDADKAGYFAAIQRGMDRDYAPMS